MIPHEIIILAGGLGTRLSALNKNLPKSLSEISGKPFLYYLIRYYQSIGLRKFIFSLGYKHNEIADYLKQSYPGLDYEIIIEDEPLGTGGATVLALNKTKDNTVLVVNGDTYFRINLSSMSGFHHMCGAECTVALKEVENAGRYGIVFLNRDYSISSFTEKGRPGKALINGGVYLVNTRMFRNHSFPNKFSLEKDYLEVYIQNSRIFGVKQSGYFIDIGIPEDLDRAQREIALYEQGMD